MITIWLYSGDDYLAPETERAICRLLDRQFEMTLICACSRLDSIVYNHPTQNCVYVGQLSLDYIETHGRQLSYAVRNGLNVVGLVRDGNRELRPARIVSFSPLRLDHASVSLN